MKNFKSKKSVIAVAAALVLTTAFVSSCSDENGNTENHENMNMETKNDMGMENMNANTAPTMFEGSKPIETATVEGVKAEFYVVNIPYANDMLKMVDEVYSGQMHPHFLSETQKECPACGMKLEKKKASEAMLDTKGRTHHIDVVLRDEKTEEKINDAKVKVKVIGPDDKSTEKMLEPNMGSYGADLNLENKGKYGIITLIRVDEKDRVAKFNFENDKPQTM